MSVLSCDIKGCKNIMCSTMITTSEGNGYYICYECIDDFQYYLKRKGCNKPHKVDKHFIKFAERGVYFRDSNKLIIDHEQMVKDYIESNGSKDWY